jgi:hypothetical protein
MCRRQRELDRASSAADVDQLTKRWSAEDAATLAAEDYRVKEVAALHQRVAALERGFRPGGPLCRAIGEAVGKITSQVQRELSKRIQHLEERQLAFRGVHEAGQHYAPGSLVVKGGGLWCCTAPTSDTPGKSSSWTLAVKSGTVGPVVA